MKVPEYWWDGFKGHKLHDGRIDWFDIDRRKWNLILDARDEDFPYLMAYDAVYKYADEGSSTYHEYQLTYEALLEGDDEIETAEGNRYTKHPPPNGIKLGMERADQLIRLSVLLMKSFLLRLQMKKSKRWWMMAKRSGMRRCFNGAFPDMVMMMMKNIHLNFKLQGCEIIWESELLKMASSQGTTLETKWLQVIMLLGSMVLVFVEWIVEGDRLIRYFQPEKY
jgi:hypothetical protein